MTEPRTETPSQAQPSIQNNVILVASFALDPDTPRIYVACLAPELTESTTEIPKNLTYYIDYKSMARDMEMNGDIFSIETGNKEIHVFWNN